MEGALGGAKWTPWGSGCFATKWVDSICTHRISQQHSISRYLNIQFYPHTNAWSLEQTSQAKEFSPARFHSLARCKLWVPRLPTLMPDLAGVLTLCLSSWEWILGLRKVLHLCLQFCYEGRNWEQPCRPKWMGGEEHKAFIHWKVSEPHLAGLYLGNRFVGMRYCIGYMTGFKSQQPHSLQWLGNRNKYSNLLLRRLVPWVTSPSWAYLVPQSNGYLCIDSGRGGRDHQGKSPSCHLGISKAFRSSVAGTWDKEWISFYTTDRF